MQQKAIAVAADGEWGIEHFGVGQCLLHPVADRKLGLFGFYDGNRKVGAAVKYEVSPLGATFGIGVFDTRRQLAAHLHATIGEVYLYSKLMLPPLRLPKAYCCTAILIAPLLNTPGSPSTSTVTRRRAPASTLGCRAGRAAHATHRCGLGARRRTRGAGSASAAKRAGPAS